LKKSLNLYPNATPKAANSFVSTNFSKSPNNLDSNRKFDFSEAKKTIMMNQTNNEFISDKTTNVCIYKDLKIKKKKL